MWSDGCYDDRVEGVEVEFPNGDVKMFPELSYREEVIPVDYINKSVGVAESAPSVASLLTRMCLKSEVVDDGENVKVEIPPTRSGKARICL